MERGGAYFNQREEKDGKGQFATRDFVHLMHVHTTYMDVIRPNAKLPALGFAARFRKICKLCENRKLQLLRIPTKLFFFRLRCAEFGRWKFGAWWRCVVKWCKMTILACWKMTGVPSKWWWIMDRWWVSDSSPFLIIRSYRWLLMIVACHIGWQFHAWRHERCCLLRQEQRGCVKFHCDHKDVGSWPGVPRAS